MLDDLPWGETSLVRVGTSQGEVELKNRSLGQELGAPAEGFQVEELILDEAVDGFDVALAGGVLTGWIVDEVLLLKQPSWTWIEVFYFCVGLIMVVLALAIRSFGVTSLENGSARV